MDVLQRGNLVAMLLEIEPAYVIVGVLLISVFAVIYHIRKRSFLKDTTAMQSTKESLDEETQNPYSDNSGEEKTENPYYADCDDNKSTIASYVYHPANEDETVNPYGAGWQGDKFSFDDAAFFDDEETVNPYATSSNMYQQASSQIFDEEETVNPYAASWNTDSQ